MEAIFGVFELIKKELVVMATAFLPVVELKGAIPVGLGMGLDKWTTFILAYIGSILPVPILLFFLKPIMNFLRRTKILKWFADWIDERTQRKGVKVRKYSLLGLFVFVAVPLPTTGVWTGSAIASFLNIRILHAFPVIALGNLVAGLIVMLVSYHLI
jgi:uncharacterized membrane protein